MDNQILIEPLRERVFIVGRDCVAFADSRALLVFSDGLPLHSNQKAQSITPQIYYVLGYGEMLPIEDLYKTATAFTKRKFREDMTTREGALMNLFTYIAEDFGVDYEFYTLVTEAENVMKNLGFSEILDYEPDIVRIFQSMVKNYKPV